MKVLHIITGLNDGGAEAVLYRLVTYDCQNEHQVISLSSFSKYGPLLREQSIPVTVLGMPRGQITLAGLLCLWQCLRASNADVVQTWMYHSDLLGGLLGWLAGLPVIWGIHNTTLEPGRSARTTIWISYLCARLSWWVPKRIIACAQAVINVHSAIGYSATRLVVVPNGYDTSRFAIDTSARHQLRKRLDVPERVPLIGMVARWDYQKDHANLFNALASLQQRGNDFRVALVGCELVAHNCALLTQIRSADIVDRVCLLGPQTDVPAIMSALDVHVLSSAYGEAFPNVLAEAMACGTPCVTTDVGDAALIVAETGWVVPPRNSVALADALQAALESWTDRKLWAIRQAACRQRILDEFSIERMVDCYRNVWQAAIR